MTDIKRLFNLMFVRSLMRLNNTQIPVELDTEYTNLNNKLNV
jgi:hypothetical protein